MKCTLQKHRQLWKTWHFYEFLYTSSIKHFVSYLSNHLFHLCFTFRVFPPLMRSSSSGPPTPPRRFPADSCISCHVLRHSTGHLLMTTGCLHVAYRLPPTCLHSDIVRFNSEIDTNILFWYDIWHVDGRDGHMFWHRVRIQREATCPQARYMVSKLIDMFWPPDWHISWHLTHRLTHIHTVWHLG